MRTSEGQLRLLSNDETRQMNDDDGDEDGDDALSPCLVVTDQVKLTTAHRLRDVIARNTGV